MEKIIIGPALSARWSLNALARQIKNKKGRRRVCRQRGNLCRRQSFRPETIQVLREKRGGGVDSWRVLYHVNPSSCSANYTGSIRERLHKYIYISMAIFQSLVTSISARSREFKAQLKIPI